MIHLVDQALEAFLRERVPLPPSSIDISFAAPDRTWGAGITRPTVNVFLWDISRSLENAASGTEETEIDGQVMRRRPPLAVDLRYVITTWATEERDEHRLLGSVVRTVLGFPIMPPDHLPEGLADAQPITIELAGGDERRASEFWSALGGQLKPGLNLQIGLPVDVFPWRPAGPRTSRVDIGVTDTTSPSHAAARATAITATELTDESEPRPAPVRRRRRGAVVLEAPGTADTLEP